MVKFNNLSRFNEDHVSSANMAGQFITPRHKGGEGGIGIRTGKGREGGIRKRSDKGRMEKFKKKRERGEE